MAHGEAVVAAWWWWHGGGKRLQAREAPPIDSAGGRRGDGREASVVAARRPVTAGMPLRHAVVDRRGGVGLAMSTH
uniref:DUF834 domain-containing protein n=1 Tax=Oryza barthii TaxID=65489 RepID=A0A0D3HWF2_9ORYZ